MLDAEQNSTFRDHYLEVPFNLSDVLFITTANTLDTIPRPLLDRMEVIELTSYTDEEKLQIAKRHLLPRERKRHGLRAGQLKLTDDAIREVIRGYTRESGVRILERRLAALCRKAAMRVVSDGVKSVHVTGDNVEEYLGVRRYHPERLPRTEQVGVVNGLAWTSVGGEILEVEAAVVPGTGKVELTGNLGDVMKESAHAALSYIRGRAAALGLPEDFYQKKDIHVHFPEGAVPKDGPSAGIAITTAMVSAPYRSPGAAGDRHDRRSHLTGPRAAHRRAEGKDHGRLPQRHQDRVPAGGQPAGSGGHRPHGSRRPALCAGGAGGHGAGRGTGAGQSDRCPRPALSASEHGGQPRSAHLPTVRT